MIECIVGLKFNRLTVEGFSHTDERGNRVWNCFCDCGNLVKVPTVNLKGDRKKSCGCQTKEAVSRAKKIHGKHGTPTYRTWRGMLMRCNNPKATSYNDYGGDGVHVCDRWDTGKGGSFENFLEDMGERPEGMTLNRIRNSKVYSKDTCEWTTLSLQCYHRKVMKNNTSGVSGVYLDKRLDKWRARIGVMGNSVILGTFKTFEEAVAARISAEFKHFGYSVTLQQEKQDEL